MIVTESMASVRFRVMLVGNSSNLSTVGSAGAVNDGEAPNKVERVTLGPCLWAHANTTCSPSS